MMDGAESFPLGNCASATLAAGLLSGPGGCPAYLVSGLPTLISAGHAPL